MLASYAHQCRLQGARLDSLLRAQDQEADAVAEELARARGREEALTLRCHHLGRQVRVLRLAPVETHRARGGDRESSTASEVGCPLGSVSPCVIVLTTGTGVSGLSS